MDRSLPSFLTLSAVLLAGLVVAACGSSDDGSEDDTVEKSSVQQRVKTAAERFAGSEGGRLVRRAIEAHGGLRAWYRAPTSSYTWEYANEGANMQFKSFLVADNRTRRVYHDLLTTGPYGDPKPVDARFAWDGEKAWIYPPSIEQPNPHFWALSGYYFEQIPFVLGDPGLNYERLQPDTLDGEVYDMVEVSFEADVGTSSGDTYTLYVDQETRRVEAIRYTVTYGQDPAEVSDPPETLLYYEDYVTVDGLTVATHFRGYNYRNGERLSFKNEAWADSISFRRPFDESNLEPPEGARIVRGP